jgi:hypothetical protein
MPTLVTAVPGRSDVVPPLIRPAAVHVVDPDATRRQSGGSLRRAGGIDVAAKPHNTVRAYEGREGPSRPATIALALQGGFVGARSLRAPHRLEGRCAGKPASGTTRHEQGCSRGCIQSLESVLPDVSELQLLFAQLNNECFGGEIPAHRIAYNDRRRTCCGWQHTISLFGTFGGRGSLGLV